jgi:energy-coupling factor transport system substrate-specific component
MTWQLGAFGVLALGLAAGFAWYERTRPDARIVALVATLAAFAALGRIAFAALPNVKPTTDIVLITGYALGGAPGFVVGALAGLTSNFFFGQGPWTPWQMAAWGVAGLIGAGLAPLTLRRISRVPLALVCMVVGFAFAATQDVGDWVTYSDHSASQLGIYVGKGVGFDFVHAAGCLAFALAFGPALRRSIERFARRLNVTWRPAGAAVVPTIAACLAAAALADAPARARAASTPTGYLLAAQRADGGFGAAPGDASDQLYAGWAALGLAAAGHNPADVSRGGPSLLAYVESAAGELPDTGALERTILVARAAGRSAADVGGHDLVGALEHRIRPDGSLAEQVNWTSFGVMALRAAGVAPAAKMLSWLARQENADGGFSFTTAGGGSDVDDTGSALETLGRRAPRAIAFLRRQQNPDGGFPSEPGGFSNAQSTAFAVQGLLAAHVALGSLRHGSPLRYLRALTAPDGHVRYSRAGDQTPVWVTAQALPALAEKPLPLAPVPRAASEPPPTGAALPTTTAASSPPNARPRRQAGATRARPARASRPAAASLSAERLIVIAGIATALVLAPVGVG